MEKEFIPYEQAVVLKELGFDEPCLGLYYPDGKFNIKEQNGLNCDSDKNSYLDSLGNSAGFCTAPLYQQVFRWFREQHKLISSVDIAEEGTEQEHYFVTISTQGSYGSFKTYEEAELECLKTLMKIVKERNQ